MDATLSRFVCLVKLALYKVKYGIIKYTSRVNVYCMEKHVTIYSTPTCHFCQMAKEFLTEHYIPFTNYDVSVDAEKRAEMISMTGQLGVPVIVIEGSVMVGFDREKIAEKLDVAA
mgnify:CR=1 FL=1